MAKIYFYDATELDREQLTAALSDTDHSWEFVPTKIDDSPIQPDAEVVSLFVSSTLTREMIEQMPNLRLVALRSTGFNNVDFEALEERGITVANVPTYGESTVAEFAFAMLLNLTRKLPEVLTTENNQFRPSQLMGIDLAGKTFGVIGAGHIGQHTISIASGFRMKVIAYDPYPNEEVARELGFEYKSLEEVIEKSDLISIHVPYIPSTHHLLNDESISRMKKGAYIINTSRGEIVDTIALIKYLDNGHLGGAAIDTVEGESLLKYSEEVALLKEQKLPSKDLWNSVEISILEKMPNVVISPHNAYNTSEAIGRINNTTAQNIINFWYGEVPNKVKPPERPKGMLIVTRHAESEWNATGQWTGITDVHLSVKGFREAGMLGKRFKDLGIKPDIAFCSEQIRSRETLEGILNASQNFDVDIERVGAINERDYGDYTGRNKWEMKEVLGEEKFNAVRRHWNEPIPNGETLKMVYERVIPFYKETILPLLHSGKNVIICAHGNSIRALMKYLETIADDDMGNVEMIFGQILVYDVDDEGRQINKEVYKIDSPAPKA